MAASPAIVGLGEILWDLLPTGRQLGGAPFNFTFHCHQLGQSAAMVSRVGTDDLGREIRQRLKDLALADDFVQSDREHATGTVTVALSGGQPTFTIHADVAWDYLEWDDRLATLIRRARAVCFGTLAQRHPVSRATIQRAIAAVGTEAIVVYDVNLRQHYYHRELLEASLHASTWVKLNDDELAVLRDLLSLSGGTAAAQLADLRERYRLDLACLTRGAAGCLVQTATEEAEVPGVAVQVVDTVGAGDAFTAGLVVAHLEGLELARAARFANLLAAQVAASAGGTPRIDCEAVRRAV